MAATRRYNIFVADIFTWFCEYLVFSRNLSSFDFAKDKRYLNLKNISNLSVKLQP
uniref:DN32944_c0_g1_i1 n=1 Tax=Ceratitis capitata TaxID=7213 RepID=A0A6B7KAS0_CERCA|nr:DN32944_c0_g1_i1 [Ceratitis capitata]